MLKRINAIQIIYFGLIVGVALFYGIAFLLVSGSNFQPAITTANQVIYKMILIFGILAGIPLVISVTQKAIGKIDSSLDLPAKLTLYQTQFLIRMAVLDGLGLLSVVFYINSGDYSVALIGVAVFIVMLLSFPSVKKIAADLNVDEESLLKD